jgi:hypothetical protein
MSTTDHSPQPVPEPAGEPAGIEAEASKTYDGVRTVPIRTATIWAFALSAALAAAVASWINGEVYFEYFKPSVAAAADAYRFTALNREKAVADRRNTVIAYGFLGLALGLGLGLAGGLARRSIAMGILAAAAGGLLGGVAGTLTSYALVPVFRQFMDPAEPTLVLPLLIHGGIWTPIGAAAGLAFGLGLGGRYRSIRGLLAGLIGGLLGTIVYEVIQAVVFPLLRNEEIIGPTNISRLMPYVCVAVFVALMAALWTPGPDSKSAPAPEAA